MKITDLKCTVLGGTPIVRITTDEGLSGLGPIESYKPYLKPHVLFYRDIILGEDPTNVERVMLKIRRLGSFKPWGAAVSAIEIALWDIAGKAAGLPIYRLLGGKVRDRVRVYNGAVRFPLADQSPESYAENMARMMASPEGFSIIKQGIAFHSHMADRVPDFFYGDPHPIRWHVNRGLLTERGLKHVVACVAAMKEVMGDRVGLALDRVGFTVEDRDRSKGRYYVRYVDPESDGQNKDPGLMSKLAFWKSAPPDPQTKYRVFVKDGGSRTTVQVLSAEGGVDQSDTSKKILGLLFEQLK